DLACTLPGTDDAPPDLVCASIDGELTTWIDYNASQQPTIYGVNAYDAASPLLCAGGPFDARNLSTDGPACLAVSVADNLGNRAVSMPIAICIDRDASGDCLSFTPQMADITALGCTDGCYTTGFGTLGQDLELVAIQ
ncbi:MAG: hypothetical protein AAB426_04695, partial [Myxococcota bacterium]